MDVHGYRSNTRNKVKRQGMYETVLNTRESFSQKKRSKLTPRQGVRKTKNRTGASKFSEEEIRRSVTFRDFA